jgi:hypothetical protein
LFFILVVRRRRCSPVVEIGDALVRSGGARLGAGVPKDETCRQVDRSDLARFVAAANPVEQDVGGDPTHLVQIPGQRRDARRCMPGEIGIADAHQRHVIGITEAVAGKCVHHAGQHVRAQRDDRGRTVGALQQLADVAERNAGTLRLRPDQVGIDRKLRLSVGLPIAGKAFRTRQQRSAPGEQRDAAMAEPDQIPRDFETAAAMIRAHRGNAGYLAIDRHAGQVQVCERAGEVGMGVVARKQQQPVHPPPAHRGYERRFAVLLVPGSRKHQHVAGALEFLLRAVDHLAVERVGEVGDHAADRLALTRTQGLRRRMRLEAQVVHRPHDAGVQFRADVRLAVHDAADAADRYTGLGCDVANCGTYRLGLAQRHCRAPLSIAARA